MKIEYDQKADALYIQFRRVLVEDNVDVEEGVTVDLDNLSFSLEAIFLPELPIALMGRDPFFQDLHVAFQHSRRNFYLEPT